MSRTRNFLFAFVFVMWSYYYGNAQAIDYITNGSFEQINSCYGTTASIGFDVFQWSGCYGWNNPRKSSTDLWCQSPAVGNVVPPSIPTIGYQYPRTGDNMAGILVGAGPHQSYYGEYLQNKLWNTLKQDYLYTIEFYVSKGFPPCTISQLGVKFYPVPFRDTLSYWTYSQIPDAENNVTNYVTDTLGWQKLSMDYIANGTENYAVFGSFADSLQLNFLATGATPCNTTGNIYPSAYLFIDDISITERYYTGPDTTVVVPPANSPVSAPAFDLVIPNVFTPNDDGINETWRVDLTNQGETHCVIFNRWGFRVFETNDNKISWNGLISDNQKCSEGVYYYIIHFADPTAKKEDLKGYIHLVR